MLARKAMQDVMCACAACRSAAVTGGYDRESTDYCARTHNGNGHSVF